MEKTCEELEKECAGATAKAEQYQHQYQHQCQRLVNRMAAIRKHFMLSTF